MVTSVLTRICRLPQHTNIEINMFNIELIPAFKWQQHHTHMVSNDAIALLERLVPLLKKIYIFSHKRRLIAKICKVDNSHHFTFLIITE